MNDMDLVMAFEHVQKNGLFLKFVGHQLQNEPLIVLAAVQKNGLALQFASPSMQENNELVLAAVRQNGLALEYVRLNALDPDDSQEVVMTALAQIRNAIQSVLNLG